MPKHDVHIYCIVRVKVPGVEADTPGEAAQKAEKATDLDYAFRDAEFAGDITGFLVDTLDENGERIKETDLKPDQVPSD
jgi:hypothetical protein